MRLQLRKEEPAARPPAPEQEEFRDRGGPPTQKDGPVQRANYGVPNSVEPSLEARFSRLERQVELLLEKMDHVLQRDAGNPRWVAPQTTDRPAVEAPRTR